MTHTELLQLRRLIALIRPHALIPTWGNVLRVAFEFETDWPRLIASVEAAIQTERSPFFQSVMQAWLADTQQEARAA